MIVTLTPHADMSPVPRVEVSILEAPNWDGGSATASGSDHLDGGGSGSPGPGYEAGNASTLVVTLPVGTTHVTLHRTCQGRRFKVRGGVDRVISGSLSLLDFEAGLNIPSTYEAECFHGDTRVGTVTLGSVTLNWVGEAEGVVLQQPLNPRLSVVVRNMSGSWPEVATSTPASLVHIEGAAYPRLIGSGPRSAAEKVALDFEATSRTIAAAVWATLGTEESQQLQVWLVRPAKFGLLPAVFFAHIADLAEVDVTVSVQNDGISRFRASVTEIAPPAPALVVGSLSYSDLAVVFGSYSGLASELTSYSGVASAWQYAGAAG